MKIIQRLRLLVRRGASEPSDLDRVLDEPDIRRQSDLLGDCLRAQALPRMREQALGQDSSQALLTLAHGLARRADDPAARRWAIRLAYDAADFMLAADLAAASPQGSAEGDEAHAALLRAVEQHVQVARAIEVVRGQRVAARPGRALTAAMCLSYSRPEASNGYAVRSHGLLCALADSPWRVRAYTRPGFPHEGADHPLTSEPPATQQVGPVLYHRLPASRQKMLGRMGYLLAAADEIEAALRSDPPAIVHAASNYTTALPAWMAARRLGLPFVYEVRGFWDITRASSDPAFAHSVECRHLRWFEQQLLGDADALLTLTPAMAAELARRGAPAPRILVAPNAVDAAQVRHPLPIDTALSSRLGLKPGVPTLGYLGSFVDYEGLDDLLDAVACLRDRGVAVQALLVGDGAMRPAWQAQAQRFGLLDTCHFTGRVPADQVANYYSLMDLCVYPRKAWPVAELVSPLKPFEAMAHGRAVLITDVAAMAWMVDDGRTGWRCPKGSAAALAAAIGDLLIQPGRLREAGLAARQEVLARRNWARSADVVQQAYAMALEHPAQRPGLPHTADHRIWE